VNIVLIIAVAVVVPFPPFSARVEYGVLLSSQLERDLAKLVKESRDWVNRVLGGEGSSHPGGSWQHGVTLLELSVGVSLWRRSSGMKPERWWGPRGSGCASHAEIPLVTFTLLDAPSWW